MRFTIPYYNMNMVEKMAKKIAKKTNNIKFEVLETVWLQYPDLPKEDPRRFKAYIIEVEGSYRINGWEFVAVLEHKDNGNIIRNISGRELPVEFRTCKPKCDHCNTLRHRKDTFVLYDEVNETYKQVGSSCLHEYTGMDLEEAAAMASFVRGIELLQKIEEQDEDFLTIKSSGYYSLDSHVFKQYAYKVVASKGYNRETTVPFILEEMSNNTVTNDEEFEEQLNQISEWIYSDTSNSEYMNNLKVAWDCSVIEHRDLKLLASGISIALKEIQDRASSTNEHVGKIGERIDVEVAFIKALYTRYNYYGDTIVYKIVDTKGHTYIYSTDKDMLKVRKFKATVKYHEEYRGIKQTVITRATVLDYVEENSSTFKQ